MKKIFLMALSILAINNSIWTMSVAMKAPSKPQLINALRSDNLPALKQFIKNYPSFNWQQLSTGLPWSVETGTPLIAAVSFKAVNCVDYLLSNNIGNIKSSINTKSSRGFTALQYAADITGKYYSPAIAQTIRNAQASVAVPVARKPYEGPWGM